MLDGLSLIFQGNNFFRLMGGLWVTLEIALVSVGISLVLGSIIGVLRLSKSKIITFFAKLHLEIVRTIPQLVLIFIVFFVSAKDFGIDLSGVISAIIVFTFWGTAEIGDLVRGAILSIPAGQKEAGLSVGLTTVQNYTKIIFPQCIKRLIPPLINLVTRMIKSTSIVVLIGVVEVLKVGQQIIDAHRFDAPTAALWIYLFIFFIYFIICFPFTRLAIYLEKRFK